HRLDGVREAAFLARGGVLVQHALAGDAVDDALRLGQRRGGGFLVAGGDRLLDVLDRAARGGAQAGVAGAAQYRLVGALARGLDVCHWQSETEKGADSSMNLLRALATVSSLTLV